jgi:hypothetical protein
MQLAPPSHDLLVHARTIISIVMGLSMARLLNGVAGLIQHPKKEHLLVAAPVLGHLHDGVGHRLLVVAVPVEPNLRTLTFETYIFPD